MYKSLVSKFYRCGRILSSAILIGSFTLFVSVSAFSQETPAGEDNVAVFNQAQDLHEKGDLAGAIKLYEKAIAIEPAFPEAEYQCGMAKLALGKLPDAERSFRRAVELKPDWTLAMTSLGSLLAQKGETAEAEKLLAKVVELEPLNSTALTALADLRRRTNASQESLKDLLAKISVLTTKANASAALWSARADLEIALAKRSDARSSVARSLAIDSKYRPALLQSASIAVSDGDLDRAKQIASAIETLTPGTDAVKMLRASIAAADGNLDDALKFLDTMATPGPESAALRNSINPARTTSAANLEKQLDKNARDPFILGRLCTLYRRDDPAKALVYCRQASEADPGNVNHAVGFAAALVQGKQYESAVGVLRKIIEIVPDNFAAHANLATALFQLKRTTEAKSEFEWLTIAQPGSAGAYLFLGIILDESGDYIGANTNYVTYLKLADPTAAKLDIEKVNLRLPSLQKLIKEKKGKP